VWCDLCQEAWNWREGEAKRGEMTRVECIKCKRRDAIVRKVSEQEKYQNKKGEGSYAQNIR